MSAIKESAQDVVRNAPEDATFDDVIYQLYVRFQTQKSAGRATPVCISSREDFEKMMHRWVVTGFPPSWE